MQTCNAKCDYVCGFVTFKSQLNCLDLISLNKQILFMLLLCPELFGHHYDQLQHPVMLLILFV